MSRPPDIWPTPTTRCAANRWRRSPRADRARPNLVVALAAAMMDSSGPSSRSPATSPTSQFNRGPFQETGRFFQGDFPSVHPALRQAELSADARRHGAARGAAGLGPDAVGPPGTGQSRCAAQRVRRGGRRRGAGAVDTDRERIAGQSGGAVSGARRAARGAAAGDHRRPGRDARPCDGGNCAGSRR